MSAGVWAGVIGVGLLLLVIAGGVAWWRRRQKGRRVGRLAIDASDDLVSQAEELADIERKAAEAEAARSVHEAHTQIVDEVNDDRSSLSDVLRRHGAGGGDS